MTDVNAQLKNALIAAIKDKNLQKLELKKKLLKTLEESVDQDIKNIENDLKHLENFDPEALTTVFSQIKIPVLPPFVVTNFSIAIDNFSSTNSQLFVDILIKANNEFFMKTSFKNPGFNNPHFTPSTQPFIHAPHFGLHITEPVNSDFQSPFNFQNPQPPFPGRQSPWAAKPITPNSFEHKNFLIQKLESIYKNLADQDVGDEILSEFDQALTALKNAKL